MNRRNTPGLIQWLAAGFIVTVSITLFYLLFQYSNSRTSLPTGITVAGINVGGYTIEEAQEIINDHYRNSPVIVYHQDNSIEVEPDDAEFKIDHESMSTEADQQRVQQDFWAGFWGFLWGRPVEVDPVPLYATHNNNELESVIELIASRLDTPAKPPQPIPGTLSFKYGEPGIQTDINASLENVADAFYRPENRVVYLRTRVVEPERPEMSILARLIINHLQDFEQNQNGTISIFIIDLTSGDEININSKLPMSGMNIAKLPIVITTYLYLDQASPQQIGLINASLTDMETTSANQLLNFIAGTEDPYLGAQIVTQTMNRLGLRNTFIAAPYEGRATINYETPANLNPDLNTNPDPAMQTTAEDIGTLLAMLYACAQNNGGALLAAFPNDITPAECQEMLGILTTNNIDSLIQAGVPVGTPVAHQQGWISDTHGDAGIVFSAGGDYVIVEYLYKPDWLEWEVSSPLLADIARAAYNFFNFENPYLDDTRSN
ncbi:MAG TPA: serine hydrolase [Anaerolineae bacterium]|nr:serine hydrolase [Anaerolineae bacterium]